MAHKKAGSSSKNGRDSVGQRLGVKAGDGQLVTAGSIIVRQRGQTFLSGPGTGLGHDYTVFATTAAAASIRAEAAEAASAAKRAGKAERAAGRSAAAAPKRRTTKSTTESASAEA